MLPDYIKGNYSYTAHDLQLGQIIKIEGALYAVLTIGAYWTDSLETLVADPNSAIIGLLDYPDAGPRNIKLNDY